MKKVFILTAAICFVFSLVANVKPLFFAQFRLYWKE